MSGSEHRGKAGNHASRLYYMGSRPDWDAYFLNLAEAVSLRADCSRRRVGAVIVDQHHRIVSTGYNGSAPGGPSCLAGECPRAKSNVEPGSSYDTGVGSCIAVHAEANALLYAGVEGCKGATLYITCAPCDGCARLIAASGIAIVVYPRKGALRARLVDVLEPRV